VSRIAIACLAIVSSVALAGAAARPAQAAVTVNIRPGPGAQFAQQAGIDLMQLQSQLETELNNLFQTYRLSDYLRSFANAQSFATRGMGVDYASNFKAVMVGFAGNLSLNVEDGYLPEGTRTKPPAGGVVPNITIMGGVNLDMLGIAPVTLYGNYFKRSGTLDDFTADLSNWGVHAQLKLFGPGDEGLIDAFLRWGGLDITTGIERAHLGLTLRSDWNRDIPVGTSGAASGSKVALKTNGQFRMDMRTFNVPLEVTTNIRLLYLLSVYGGAGFDWQLGGGSDMTVDLAGNMVGVTPAGGGMPAQMVDLGTADVDLDEAVDPSPGRLRWILGAQLNVMVLRLFVQLNIATQDPVLASLALGLRVAF
jgi:hypothetical protein